MARRKDEKKPLLDKQKKGLLDQVSSFFSGRSEAQRHKQELTRRLVPIFGENTKYNFAKDGSLEITQKLSASQAVISSTMQIAEGAKTAGLPDRLGLTDAQSRVVQFMAAPEKQTSQLTGNFGLRPEGITDNTKISSDFWAGDNDEQMATITNKITISADNVAIMLHRLEAEKPAADAQSSRGGPGPAGPGPSDT